MLSGLIVGAVTLGLSSSVKVSDAGIVPASVDNTSALSESLFMKNVFDFEALGVLLLVIAVGTVALSRSRGGTHARD